MYALLFKLPSPLPIYISLSHPFFLFLPHSRSLSLSSCPTFQTAISIIPLPFFPYSLVPPPPPFPYLISLSSSFFPSLAVLPRSHKTLSTHTGISVSSSPRPPNAHRCPFRRYEYIYCPRWELWNPDILTFSSSTSIDYQCPFCPSSIFPFIPSLFFLLPTLTQHTLSFRHYSLSLSVYLFAFPSRSTHTVQSLFS